MTTKRKNCRQSQKTTNGEEIVNLQRLFNCEKITKIPKEKKEVKNT